MSIVFLLAIPLRIYKKKRESKGIKARGNKGREGKRVNEINTK
jgi:hypothetical protein